MCTIHLIKPAIYVNAAGRLNVNMVKLTSGWYYKMYNIATNVDLHITIHNDKANSLILLPFMSIHYPANYWSGWMLAGVVTIHSSSNVTQLADELGKFVTDAIPGFDAITGSDMTS